MVFLEFFKDKSLLWAFSFLLLFEVCLQVGVYKPFLKKNSYASNVNRITDHILEVKERVNPNILIVGTSLAYEGISLQKLNEILEPFDHHAQSVAIPGADLMVQDMAVQKVKNSLPNLKYVIHLNEIQMPWVEQSKPSDFALSMISEFPRLSAIQKLKEDQYELTWEDYGFVAFRLVAYRRDMGELFLAPDKRWKDFIRARREKGKNLYSYENSYLPSLSLYPFQSIGECIELTKFGTSIPKGSDIYHKEAVWKTCNLVNQTRLPLGKNEITQKYRLRLENMYKKLKNENIVLINVFPPLPTYLDPEDSQKRIEFWKTEYREILSDPYLDLFHSIPIENNADYYYDMIHLNQKGMQLFTQILGEALIPILTKGN
jgi:hypothetical protein